MHRILIALAALFLFSCATVPPKADPAEMSGPGAGAAVSFLVGCGQARWAGSGVLIDSRHVLTAHHVIACSQPMSAFLITTPTGAWKRGTVLRADVAGDVALVELGSAASGAPVRFGPRPRLGDGICFYPKRPKSIESCGKVTALGSADTWKDVRHSAVTARGNSGAGVYDSKDRLVGIVTHLTIGGGAFTSLESRGWILP